MSMHDRDSRMDSPPLEHSFFGISEPEDDPFRNTQPTAPYASLRSVEQEQISFSPPPITAQAMADLYEQQTQSERAERLGYASAPGHEADLLLNRLDNPNMTPQASRTISPAAVPGAMRMMPDQFNGAFHPRTGMAYPLPPQPRSSLHPLQPESLQDALIHQNLDLRFRVGNTGQTMTVRQYLYHNPQSREQVAKFLSTQARQAAINHAKQQQAQAQYSTPHPVEPQGSPSANNLTPSQRTFDWSRTASSPIPQQVQNPFAPNPFAPLGQSPPSVVGHPLQNPVQTPDFEREIIALNPNYLVRSSADGTVATVAEHLQRYGPNVRKQVVGVLARSSISQKPTILGNPFDMPSTVAYATPPHLRQTQSNAPYAGMRLPDGSGHDRTLEHVSPKRAGSQLVPETPRKMSRLSIAEQETSGENSELSATKSDRRQAVTTANDPQLQPVGPLAVAAPTMASLSPYSPVFNNLQQGTDFVNRPRRQLTIKNGTDDVHEISRNAGSCVRMIYEAIRGVPATPTPYQQGNIDELNADLLDMSDADERVQAMACMIITQIIALHTRGDILSADQFRKETNHEKEEQGMLAKARLQLCCDVLKDSKRVFISLLDSPTWNIIRFVAAPGSYEQRKYNNKTGNKRKQMQLARGKAVIAGVAAPVVAPVLKEPHPVRYPKTPKKTPSEPRELRAKKTSKVQAESDEDGEEDAVSPAQTPTNSYTLRKSTLERRGSRPSATRAVISPESEHESELETEESEGEGDAGSAGAGYDSHD